MGRTYSPQTMVQLPVLNAPRAVALGESLLSQARSERERVEAGGIVWPDLLVPAQARLEAAVAELSEALAPMPDAEALGRERDIDLDRAWSAFRNWTEGVLQQPDEVAPEIPKLRDLANRIFSEGLEFLTLTLEEEFVESRARLSVIEDEGYVPVVEALGGSWFLDTLREAQDALGEAIHVTDGTPKEVTSRVREPLDKLDHELRGWVVKVVAINEPEVAGWEALSENLLLPLVQWENPDSGSSAGSDAVEASSEEE